MSQKAQLVIFELLGGLFGWIWIGAVVAFIVFIGLAFFGDWSWWNVLWAFLVGGVSKWLTRGFLDNKKRVLFEQQLIEQGASKEEAAQRWVKEFKKGRI